MTSSPPTATSPVASRYRCTACDREFAASSAYVRHGLSHLVDPSGRSPRVCFRGRWEPVAAVQPVGGDQLVAGGAGQGEHEGDPVGHGISVGSTAGGVTAHASDDGAQPFAAEAACPR